MFYVNYTEKNNIYNGKTIDQEKNEDNSIILSHQKLMNYISSHSMFKNIFITGFYFPEDNIVHPNNISNIEEYIQENKKIKNE